MFVLFNRALFADVFKTPFLRNALIGYAIIAITLPLYGILNQLLFHSILLLSILGLIILIAMTALLLSAKRGNLERLKMNDELRKSEERYRTILDSVDEGYFEVDLKGKFTFFNDWMVKALETSRKELLTADNRDFMVPESSREIFKVFNTIFRTGEPARTVTYEISTMKGTQRSHEMSASLIKDPAGEPIGFRGIARDVTERKQVEDTLIATRNFLQDILNSSIDGIMTTDMHGVITYCTTSFLNMTGYAAEELLGKKVGPFYGEGLENAKIIMGQLSDKGEVRNYETQFRKKSGGPIDIMLSASLLKNDKAETVGTLGIFKDVTGKKATELKLQEAQRLEAVSILAGGVAHEFNNALMGIVGYVELLEMHLPKTEEILEYTQPMRDSTQRMANLTKQLLAYAQGGRYEAKTISLSDFVREALPVLQHELDPDIDFRVDLSDDFLHVKADRTQMQMVLSAVLNNASEAIESDGRIKVSVRSGEIDEDFAHPDLQLLSGTYICLRVEDSGKGMHEETRSKIFEPFFSTKFLGRGLGMAAVHGIVANHGGVVSVESELDKGTIVRIYLPAVDGDKDEKDREDLIYESADKSRTILVIEDEDLLLDINCAMLENLGYNALKARTGKGALEIAETHKGGIDLVMLDVKLPDMGGEKVYQGLIQIDPAMKVVVCSGYSADGPTKEILDAGAHGFIQKPFTIAALSAEISDVLGTE